MELRDMPPSGNVDAFVVSEASRFYEVQLLVSNSTDLNLVLF